jgi:hypothetical protein
MTIPGFLAEGALSKTTGRYWSAASGLGGRPMRGITPAQSLFPPGTPIYTCSPPCTWGPPMTQTCCAEICFYFPSVGRICFPQCFTRTAPLCPQ